MYAWHKPQKICNGSKGALFLWMNDLNIIIYAGHKSHKICDGSRVYVHIGAL